MEAELAALTLGDAEASAMRIVEAELRPTEECIYAANVRVYKRGEKRERILALAVHRERPSESCVFVLRLDRERKIASAFPIFQDASATIVSAKEAAAVYDDRIFRSEDQQDILRLDLGERELLVETVDPLLLGRLAAQVERLIGVAESEELSASLETHAWMRPYADLSSTDAANASADQVAPTPVALPTQAAPANPFLSAEAGIKGRGIKERWIAHQLALRESEFTDFKSLKCAPLSLALAPRSLVRPAVSLSARGM